jgi:protein translocase SEC61 complex gamma subunit
MRLNLKERLMNYKRILSITKKPNIEDLIFVSKITAISMCVIGTIGFIIYLISILFLG